MRNFKFVNILFCFLLLSACSGQSKKGELPNLNFVIDKIGLIYPDEKVYYHNLNKYLFEIYELSDDGYSIKDREDVNPIYYQYDATELILQNVYRDTFYINPLDIALCSPTRLFERIDTLLNFMEFKAFARDSIFLDTKIGYNFVYFSKIPLYSFIKGKIDLKDEVIIKSVLPSTKIEITRKLKSVHILNDQITIDNLTYTIVPVEGEDKEIYKFSDGVNSFDIEVNGLKSQNFRIWKNLDKEKRDMVRR